MRNNVLLILASLLILSSCAALKKVNVEAELERQVLTEALEGSHVNVLMTQFVGDPSQLTDGKFMIKLRGKEAIGFIPAVPGAGYATFGGGVEPTSYTILKFDCELVKSQKGKYIYKLRSQEPLYNMTVRIEASVNGGAYVVIDHQPMLRYKLYGKLDVPGED